MTERSAAGDNASTPAVSPGPPHDDAALLRSLFAALDDGVVYQRADGAILASNPSAERMLGLTAEQLAGRAPVDPRWKVVRANGDPFPVEDHPAQVSLRTGEPCRDVIMGIENPDGAQIWISITTRPLVHPGATQPHAVVVTFTEVTERKRMEDERDELLSGLAQSLIRRGLMLRTVLDLASETTADDVLHGVLHAAIHLVQAEHGSVTRWDEAQQRLLTIATTIPGIVPGFMVALGQGMTGQAAEQRRPIIFNAFQQEAEASNPARATGISAAAAVPLLHDGQLIGALAVTTAASEQRFTQDDAEDLQLLAAIAAAVLMGVERAQIHAITAAARELAHLINNDLSLAVGALGLIRENRHVEIDLAPFVDGALRDLAMASNRLEQLGQIRRLRTRPSPVGEALDLHASADHG